MSDTTNRDKGRKESHKKNKRLCNCWLCLPSREKKIIALERASKLMDDKGYSIGTQEEAEEFARKRNYPI